MENKFITKKGQEVIQRKLQHLRERFKEVSRGKMEAAEAGGNLWHDNPAYEEVEAEQRMLLNEMDKLNQLLLESEVVESQPKDKTRAGIGAKIEIEFSNGERRLVTLGDSFTTNPSGGIISYESPLGQALLGGKIGDKRNYSVGDKTFQATIKSIEYK